jgi:hypothetical protein
VPECPSLLLGTETQIEPLRMQMTQAGLFKLPHQIKVNNKAYTFSYILLITQLSVILKDKTYTKALLHMLDANHTIQGLLTFGS